MNALQDKVVYNHITKPFQVGKSSFKFKQAHSFKNLQFTQIVTALLHHQLIEDYDRPSQCVLLKSY